jgi:ATP-binding cassette subfamily B protein
LLATDGGKLLIGQKLLQLLFVILILNGARWSFHRAGIFVLNNFESKTMSRIKQMSFNYMLKHSYSFFANNFSGSLVQRVSRFGRAFERLYDTLLFSILPLFINIVFITIVVWLQEPLIAYLVIVWVFLISTFSYYFSNWKLKYDLESTKADSATTGFLADAITNQNTIASFAGFNREFISFRDTADNQAKAQKLTWNLSSITDAVQAAFIVMVEFLIFYYAIRFWQKDLVTLGTFVLLQVYILGLGDKLWDLSKIIRNVYEGFADSKEMVEILETPYEIKDLPGAKTLEVRSGKIEFKEMTFAFNETRTVLENINLEIKSGEKVALIGPSGAGKSTIVKLLLRMYDLASGSIEIDGQNIKNVTQDSLRRNVSLVPQDPILFHRTLLENIRYGREDATNEEVIQAAKLAHCDEFIEMLPLKYETFVGERGIKLSGGERQRVAIARAILKNAPILILDEATSSLDSHSESLIQDALDKLMKDKTSIVIAHRLSTIRKMDRVVVVDGGKITEEGTHDELLRKEKSLYKNLWNLQAGGFLPE